jgi:V/A-type H+-transporting ATPase subunit A
VLEMSRMVKEVFLQQNAFSDDDAYSSLEKTGALLDALLSFYDESQIAINQGVELMAILDDPIKEEISRLREVNSEGFTPKKEAVMENMKSALQKLVAAAE